ncbi:restriction endonuclease subunit S [Acinetobacter johnsonii]|uniref:restriction endonuclease subunit S n=1 Tax=Acinetobacter johnsonii TaxID=40214 RepID=UPI003AF6C8DF
MKDVKKLITEHLDIWLTAETEKKSGRGRSSGSANSIYGVQKLRKLIVQLAISGKLIPQVPTDEPAVELVKQINIEKIRLVKEGKLKKLKSLSEIMDEEKPFKIPSKWEWVRLGDILEMLNGRAFKPTEWIEEGLPIVRIQNLNNSEATFNFCDEGSVDNRHIINNGSFLISWSGTPGTSFGAFIWNGGKAALNQHIFSCFQLVEVYYSQFLMLAINARLEELIAKAHGAVGLQHITKGKLEALPLVLPSKKEQQRIVSKVDELMQLCDQLEQQQNLSSEAHDQLVDTLLSVLSNSSDFDEFQQNWQRISENFDLLFTTEYSIEQLKQTILQLAVMGRLVKQNSNDEPASELLKKIAEEKSKLVKEGKIKQSKPLPEISDEEKPLELPSGWIYTKIADLCRPISSGSTPSADKFTQSGIPFLKVYNIRDQKIDFSYKEQFVDDEIHKGKLSRSRLYPNDVVMNIVGPPLGKIAIIPDDYPEWNCNQAIVFFGVLIPDISEYLYTYLCEGSFLNQIELIGTAGQDNISVTKSQNIVMPLPPLNEQRRIVKKVNQLFSIIEQFQVLQSKLRKTKLYLADSLVVNALSGSDDKNEPEITDNIFQFEKPIENVKQSNQNSTDQIDLFADESMDNDLKLLSLAAEITFQLHTEPTFGHLKLQKLIYLCQQLKHMDLAADFRQHAAGPYDPVMARYLDREFKNREWFSYDPKRDLKYKPLSKCNDHRSAFNKYFAKEVLDIYELIGLFRTSKSDHIEIVTTLFACWLRLLEKKLPVTEEQLMKDFYAWSEDKKKFSKTEVLNGLVWMKHNSIVPR